MKNQLTLFLLLLSSSIYGQEFSVFLGPSMPIMNGYDLNFDNTSTFTSLDFNSLPDTIFTRQTTRSFGTQRTTFKAKIGARGGLDMHWKVNSNFGIEAGIHGNLYGYQPDVEFLDFGFEFISKDTLLPGDPEINNPFGGVIGTLPRCDRFTNSFEDFSDTGFRTSFNIIDLYLPLKFTYSIWEDEIKISLGTYAASTIYAKNNFRFINQESELINGEHVCTFVESNQNNDVRQNFSSLNFGATAGLEYALFDHLKVLLSVDQRITPLFKEFGVGLGESDRPAVRPVFVSAGVKYVFNPKQKASQPTDNQ